MNRFSYLQYDESSAINLFVEGSEYLDPSKRFIFLCPLLPDLEKYKNQRLLDDYIELEREDGRIVFGGIFI